MKLIERKAFLAWAGEQGIIEDDRYGPPQRLIFKPYRETDRFWLRPESARAMPRFLNHIVTGLGHWTDLYLWPRGGQWPSLPIDERHVEQMVNTAILRGAGVPLNDAGGLSCSRDDLPQILAIGFAQMSFGWNVSDDLFLVPDNGRAIVYIDHHEVVHVEMSDEADVEPFVQHMANGGFPLPEDVPDWTFIRPTWMPDTPGAMPTPSAGP